MSGQQSWNSHQSQQPGASLLTAGTVDPSDAAGRIAWDPQLYPGVATLLRDQLVAMAASMGETACVDAIVARIESQIHQPADESIRTSVQTCVRIAIQSNMVTQQTLEIEGQFVALRLLVDQHGTLIAVCTVIKSRERQPAEPPVWLGELTARETEVLHLLVTGLTNKQIAARLFLSPRTVEKHRARVHRKSGTKNVADLTRQWMSAGGDSLLESAEESSPGQLSEASPVNAQFRAA